MAKKSGKNLKPKQVGKQVGNETKQAGNGKRVRIIQISDLHCGAVDSEKKIVAAARMINSLKADAIVVCGDLTSAGYLSEYESAREMLKLFKPKPIIVPGNHDSRHAGTNLFRQIFPTLPSRHEVAKDFVIYALDTTLPDVDDGMLHQTQLTWLFKNASTDKHKYKIVVMHHHLVPVPHTGRERNILYDAGDALELLISCKFNLALCGHKHVPHVWFIEGLGIINAPTIGALNTILHYKNSFNVIDIENGSICVEMLDLQGRKTRLATMSSDPSIYPRFHNKCDYL